MRYFFSLGHRLPGGFNLRIGGIFSPSRRRYVGGRVGGAFGGSPYVAQPAPVSGWTVVAFLLTLAAVEYIAMHLPR
jgi:hypothetical protein